ncbi:Rho termination factor N-terminal domain-containing protein [Aliidiomarina soli]|uniref:Addiction module toxin RelE n=1 Tax=Aliidiomarina soli TaxID=1928574 RepID=A0A432WHK0_9GAMM|nr:Rho termination factor N-terminal domain-containing protein [Aliidiomarina soli]RUO33243.1 addiction module toxin RelE [Aliidiomarina soli]
MPKAWSDKDERQYQHVKSSERKRGKSNADAEEIAARTVNQQRQQEGRSESKQTKGTGNPNTPLEERTKQQLYNRAAELSIKGRSSMNKDKLIAAIRQRQ